MKRSQGGFTLIELVVVIVILGILAATALPKFIDLSSEAGEAAAAGVAGGLTSASSINYAGKMAGKSTSALTPNSLSAVAADVCKTDATAAGGLLVGGFPAGFTIGAGGARTCSADGVVECVITNTKTSKSATAVLTCY